ncbi:DegT/DnrJ/EryC1/StrS family aminotransferase [Estrella lausannensis]|uniref:UDP-2-acetamido-2-deoxy-3-oxo-D-glucuronateaminot ransferase n=1 Tax=Estrella lausannensis TaxID=483423 RepID=A0A0H5DQ55_9BACT|nr:DegT/DnrJ/EryC1/StrS family aminotransferase [Estrella lausannensis]CRX38766.1 UDP-2-acetamido-2-deoxy-3-oxo-D-glucuronateaminotransferase [Estrella lausannensis]
MEFIDIKTPYRLHKQEIDQAIHKVLDKGAFIMGEEVAELEKQLAAYVGAKHCIGVSSGTCSLMIALMALGVGPGDEVITVPFTWISTAEVIPLVGAKPVFVDIESDSYNIDPEKLKRAITKKTKAIITVNLFGQMADYSRINPIAEEHGIPIIEDAAQSFGAKNNQTMSCSATLIGSTSFFPAKPFGCYGDGGALFTSDDQLAAKMRAIRTHGGEVRHHHPYLGLNGRLDTMQAAILLAKFPHFQKEVEARQQLGERYNRLLEEFVSTPRIMPGNTHVFAQYTFRVSAREEVAKALKERGVPTAIYYPKCLHEQPVFSSLGYGKGSFPVSEKAAQEVLSIPMHPYLTEKDQLLITTAVKEAVSPFMSLR